MTNFLLDGKAFTAKPDENLLQACLGAGIDLPYFCWHPALGSVGACRQCAIKQYANADDKTGQMVMACMTPIAEGARFSLADPEAAEFRASVIEWLMINHPHDCPVCEEGGECHLQDMTVMTGHAQRRYRFTKRTHQNQNLGPFIKHEMNRCIACYRCTRFYRDYAGGRDLDVFAAHDHVYFGRHADGTLESEFSGNLVEVCPTGVFTDKPFSARYARKWDMRGAPSICTHCGVGCNTTANERAGELRRILNRYNGSVNGYFLCDRGRFGYGFVNAPERIRTPLARNPNGTQTAISREDAIARFTALLGAGARVIGIGSPRASLEANFALRTLVGAENFYPGVSAHEGRLLHLIADILSSGAVHSPSLREVEQADAALVLGADVPNAAPRAALALRQMVRSAGVALAAENNIPYWQDSGVRTLAGNLRSPLFIATPAATRLDDIAHATMRAAPADIARLGFAVAAAIDPTAPAVAAFPADLAAQAGAIAEALLAAERPLIVSGVEAGDASVIQAAANIATALRARGKSCALMLNVPECNSLGLALMANGQAGFEAALAEPAALVIVLENELSRRTGNATAPMVVLDHSAGPTSQHAELVLPAASFAESGGTLVNSEGRAQRFYQPVFAENDIREAWRWLSDAGGKGWNSEDDILAALADAIPCFAALPRTAPPETFRIAGSRIASAPHRFSGRTSMNADHNVREPKPPVSADSPFSTTMEGYYGKLPPALLPYVWAPGWNSVQSINKFQAEIGGALEGGDPGVRLLEARAEAVLPYYTGIPEAFAPRAGMWHAVVLPRVFGDDEQSARATPIRERMTPPALALNGEDAALIGAAAGQMLACEVAGEQQHLALEIHPELPRGVAGIAGLAAKAHALPAWIHITKSSAGRIMNEITVGLLNIILGLAFALVMAALLTWVERRLLGFWQDRYGPNRAGPFGVLQAAADGIKLLFKQDWIPPFADPAIFVLAPAIAMVTVILALAVIPATPVIGIIGNLNIGLLFFLAMSGLGVYSVVLAGWSSNNKFSLLGGMRAAAQMVSYEVFMGLSLVGVVMLSGSFNLTDIVHSQRHLWFVVPQCLGCVVFFLGGIAETHRLPFDLPEGESELGAGFHTEYSGMKFGMFFIGEYIGIMLVSAMTTVLFLGGWYGPVLPPILWFAIKTGLLIAFFILLRAALPRPRYDQFMAFGWKLLLPLTLLNILVTGALMLAGPGIL